MELEALKGKIKSELEKLEREDKKRGLSSYLPQLTFYKIHGLTYKENFHSKFLAFLLNPKGQHGCGNEFLKYFIERIKEKGEKNLEASSLKADDYEKAVTEKGSKINRKQISGGRVDICICKTFNDNEKKIIIENKINAIDQWAQLLRISRTYPCSTIVYLTPLDRPASSYSLNYQDKVLKEKDYIRISYKDDIKEWLYQCLKYIKGDTCKLDNERKNKLSMLLNDYLTVIKELTYVESINEIILPELSKDLDSVKFAFENHVKIKEITKYNTIFHLKKYLVKEKFIENILNDLTENIGDGLKWKINERRSIMQKGWGFQFYKEKWEKVNVKIGLYFRKNNLRDCKFGFQKYTSDNNFIPEDWKLINSIWYPLEPMPEKYRNWYREVFYQFMPDYTGEPSFYNFMKEKLQVMCGKIEKILSNNP